METISSRRIARTGVVAALYVVLTFTFSFMAYDSIQFRVAEMLMLLCLFSKDFVTATTIGCIIANIFSPIGVVDVVVGSLATFLSGVCIYLLRNKLNPLTASLFPVIFNAVIVGIELKVIYQLPLFMSMAQVAFGEVVCVGVIGVILLSLLKRNSSFMKMLSEDGK